MQKLHVLAALIAGLGCSDKQAGGGCTENGDCGSGQVCVTGQCLSICRSDIDCTAAGTICINQLCAAGARSDTPVITGIDGDGPVDPDPAHSDHQLRQQIVVTGTHLEGATAVLIGGASDRTLEICSSMPERLVATLPSDLTAGAYTLRVSNQA